LTAPVPKHGGYVFYELFFNADLDVGRRFQEIWWSGPDFSGSGQ